MARRVIPVKMDNFMATMAATSQANKVGLTVLEQFKAPRADSHGVRMDMQI